MNIGSRDENKDMSYSSMLHNFLHSCLLLWLQFKSLIINAAFVVRFMFDDTVLHPVLCEACSFPSLAFTSSSDAGSQTIWLGTCSSESRVPRDGRHGFELLFGSSI